MSAPSPAPAPAHGEAQEKQEQEAKKKAAEEAARKVEAERSRTTENVHGVAGEQIAAAPAFHTESSVLHTVTHLPEKGKKAAIGAGKLALVGAALANPVLATTGYVGWKVWSKGLSKLWGFRHLHQAGVYGVNTVKSAVGGTVSTLWNATKPVVDFVVGTPLRLAYGIPRDAIRLIGHFIDHTLGNFLRGLRGSRERVFSFGDTMREAGTLMRNVLSFGKELTLGLFQLPKYALHHPRATGAVLGTAALIGLPILALSLAKGGFIPAMTLIGNKLALWMGI